MRDREEKKVRKDEERKLGLGQMGSGWKDQSAERESMLQNSSEIPGQLFPDVTESLNTTSFFF